MRTCLPTTLVDSMLQNHVTYPMLTALPPARPWPTSLSRALWLCPWCSGPRPAEQAVSNVQQKEGKQGGERVTGYARKLRMHKFLSGMPMTGIRPRNFSRIGPITRLRSLAMSSQ